MKILKLIGVVLDYPAEALWEHRDELLEAAAGEALAPARSQQLSEFIGGLLALEPMAAQERWLGLFDRGRHMSLLLFEHVHGESRDRGQAMVNLLETYRSGGFDLAARELPDYLPLVLEYLSRRPPDEARDWLQHTAHILKLLAARAAERSSPYAVLFEALVEIAEGEVELEIARRCALAESRDDTAEAMDRVWEEEAVRFGPEAPATDCKPPQRPGAGGDSRSQVMP